MFQCGAPSTSLSQLKEREENLTTRVLAVEEALAISNRPVNKRRSSPLPFIGQRSGATVVGDEPAWLATLPARLQTIESNIATTLDWSVNIFSRARIDVLRAEIFVRQLLADRSKTASGSTVAPPFLATMLSFLQANQCRGKILCERESLTSNPNDLVLLCEPTREEGASPQ